MLPTTHDAAGRRRRRRARGVAQVAAEVGADRVELVTHSTTQAVNALLEGDVGRVGVIGLGRRPGPRARPASRTPLDRVDLSPGTPAGDRAAFLDVTDGLPADEIAAALERLSAQAGATAACVAEAFAPDDDRNETAVADAAPRDAGCRPARRASCPASTASSCGP